MIARVFLVPSVMALALLQLAAQSPAPVIVQAVVPAVTVPVAAPAPVTQPTDSNETLKALQQIKATNADVLTKQAETLLQLDELEKAAEQIKIYSKRG